MMYHGTAMMYHGTAEEFQPCLFSVLVQMRRLLNIKTSDYTYYIKIKTCLECEELIEMRAWGRKLGSEMHGVRRWVRTWVHSWGWGIIYVTVC